MPRVASARGRRERQKEARERRILQAAEALFERRGYRETSMLQIARRARLAVGTLYNYFPSKPDLLAALLRRDTEDALAAGEVVVKGPPDDPARAVGELVAVYVRLALRHDRGLWRELLGAAIANPGSLTAAALESDLRLLGQVSQLLEELRARGALRPDADSGQGAIALYAVYVTWFVAYVASDSVSSVQLRNQIRAGIEVVLRGLAPARPQRGAST